MLVDFRVMARTMSIDDGLQLVDVVNPMEGIVVYSVYLGLGKWPRVNVEQDFFPDHARTLEVLLISFGK